MNTIINNILIITLISVIEAFLTFGCDDFIFTLSVITFMVCIFSIIGANE